MHPLPVWIQPSCSGNTSSGRSPRVLPRAKAQPCVLSSMKGEAPSSWLPLQALMILVLSLGIVGCGNADPAARNGSVTTPPETFHNASEVRRDSVGTIVLVKGDNLSGEVEGDRQYESLVQAQSYGEMALFFVQHHGNLFRLVDPSSEAITTKVQSDDLGYHQVRLAQSLQDLPVLNAEMIVHFDPESHIYLVQSQFIPTPIGLSLTPALTEDEVVDAVAATAGSNVTIGEPMLAILPRQGQIPKLVYQLEVRRSMVDSRSVSIDANSGAVIREVPTVYTTR